MSHRIRFARRNWPRFASNQCFVLSPLLKKISRGLGNVVCLSVTLVRIIIEMETNRSLWPFVTRFFFLLSFMSRLHLFLASLLFMSLHYNNRAKSTHTHYRHHTRRRSIWIEWIRQLCAHPSNSHIWCIWNGPTLIKNELTIFFYRSARQNVWERWKKKYTCRCRRCGWPSLMVFLVYIAFTAITVHIYVHKVDANGYLHTHTGEARLWQSVK